MTDEQNRQILENLQVYNPVNPKIHLGGHGDGGYVLIDGLRYDSYVSCGLGHNLSFDAEFIKYRPDIPYFGFDGTVDRHGGFPNELQFFKKNIGIVVSENSTNLEVELTNYHDIFLKMDIEGWEWSWLKNYSLLHKFKQIVIELHGLFDPSWMNIATYEYADIPEALKILNKTHFLVHLHGNNAADIKPYKDEMYPTVVEVVFIRKYNPVITGLNFTPLPIPNLDYANYGHMPDVDINKWPFVTK